MASLRSASKQTFSLVLRASAPALATLYRLARGNRPIDKLLILVYHKISDLREGADAEWNTTAHQFRAHLSAIRDLGLRVISVEQLWKSLRDGDSFPEHSVLITFDDGYSSVYREAYPALQEVGFPAAVFVTVGSVEQGRLFWWDEPVFGDRRELWEEVRPLSWDELRRMADSDLITVGSHSMTHPHLGRLGTEAIEYEVFESKRIIEERLDREVAYFAFPGGIRRYGDFSETVIGSLERAGYKLAFTSEIGRNEEGCNRYEIKRIGVGQWDTPGLFRAKLEGAYDWVGLAQRTFQRVFGSNY